MRTQKLLFPLIAALLLWTTRANAQGWERLYPGVSPGAQASEFVKILPTADGGFLLLCGDYLYGNNPFDLHLVKITASGTKDWVRHYDFGALEIPQDMIATSDGGYAVLYQTPGQSQSDRRTFVLKLNAAFDPVLQEEVQFPSEIENMRGRQLIEVQQQIAVFGTARIADAGLDNAPFVYGIDFQGNNPVFYHEWAAQDAEFVAAVPAPGGSFTVLYSTRDAASLNHSLALSRVDPATGLEYWQLETAEPGSIYRGGDLLGMADGGCLAGASVDNQGYLIRLDSSGNLIWQKTLDTPDSFPAPGIERLALTHDATGFWATGTSPDGLPKIVIGRFDLQGNLLWYKTLEGFSKNNTALDLTPTDDGGCLLAGHRGNSASSSLVLPYAARITANGDAFLSGLSGKVSRDLDNDCLADADSLLAGHALHIWQNGQLVASAIAGPDDRYAVGLDTGDYIVTVDKPNNAWSFCPDSIPVTVVALDSVDNVDFTAFFNPQPVDSIYGSVFEDIDGDCVRDSFETGYAGWVVVAIVFEPGFSTQTFVRETDADGRFSITDLNGFSNTASGFFSIAPPGGDGLTCTYECNDAFNIQFLNSNSYEAAFGVHCDTLPPCPILDVDIATNALRPCTESTYHVQYCNNGYETAEDAYVEVTIDSALQVLNASIPWSTVVGNVYTFPLGDIPTEDCGSFTIKVFTPCGAPLGTTYCVEAHAFPDTSCLAPGLNWDGSQIEVTAACDGDSVLFMITNVGNAPMSQVLNYIVTEDNVMLMQVPGSFQLGPGEVLTLRYPANGSFWRLDADQSPGLSYLSAPAAWAEGCSSGSGTVSLGFVNQYALPDDEPWLDIFCLESVNAFDPNDKNAFPSGYGAEHFIEQNTDLEYLIRFQNTGTAPAIDVEIRDTIPVQWLDPHTVRPGASSHPCVWDMQGNGVVTFRFPGIQLPDSSTSPTASQGFVKFRVSQRPDVPLGTHILNTAAIYFDHNEPVITNQTWHTVGKNFMSVSTGGPSPRVPQVRLSPNPTTGWVQIQVEGLGGEPALHLRLVNQLGRTVLEKRAPAAAFWFDATHLPAGVYYYEIRDGGRVAGAGRLVKTGN